YRNWTGDSEINQFLPPHQLLMLKLHMKNKLENFITATGQLE
ncbi:uncharacterized protein METZ01_LOCUS470121, partial [marine metagenome]